MQSNQIQYQYGKADDSGCKNWSLESSSQLQSIGQQIVLWRLTNKNYAQPIKIAYTIDSECSNTSTETLITIKLVEVHTLRIKRVFLGFDQRSQTTPINPIELGSITSLNWENSFGKWDPLQNGSQSKIAHFYWRH